MHHREIKRSGRNTSQGDQETREEIITGRSGDQGGIHYREIRRPGRNTSQGDREIREGMHHREIKRSGRNASQGDQEIREEYITERSRDQGKANSRSRDRGATKAGSENPKRINSPDLPDRSL